MNPYDRPVASASARMLAPASYFLRRSAASRSRSPPVTRLPFLRVSATVSPSLARIVCIGALSSHDHPSSVHRPPGRRPGSGCRHLRRAATSAPNRLKPVPYHPSMRHAVLGAGGVGGLLAAALVRSGTEVVLLMRPETLLRYPGRVTVRSKVLGDFSEEIPAAAALDRPVDVVWITP